MYLLALCWYFQPDVYPILAFLSLEFVVKLLQRQSQIHCLVRSDDVPPKLEMYYDPVTYEKCRRYTLRCCVLQCMSLVPEQLWKVIQIFLGTKLFDLTLIKLSSFFVILRENLNMHWLTLEIFLVTALFTVCKRFFFLYKPVCQKLIDEKYHLSVQTWDSFIYHFITKLSISLLRNSISTALFVEISSIVYDKIGYTWPSLFSAYLITFVGVPYILEFYSKNTSDDVKIISATDGSLYNFIAILADQNQFRKDSILISNNSERTSKLAISYSGLLSPKIIVGNSLLEKYQRIFNPPVRDINNDTLQTYNNTRPRNWNRNGNDARDENVPEINDGGEILSLLTVQLAHWINNDNWALEIFQIGCSVVNLTLLSFILMPDSMKIISEFLCLEETTTTSLFAAEFLLFHWAKEHMQTSMQRDYELEADKFAVHSGYGQDLRKALMEIHSHNLEFPLMDKFYQLNSDRNSLLSRIESIDRESAQCVDAHQRRLQVYSVANIR